METLTIPTLFDAHLHLRQGNMLADVLPSSTTSFGGGIIMPNRVPEVVTGEQAVEYKREINVQVKARGASFKPFMTIKLINKSVPKVSVWTTPEIIRSAKKMGVVAAKAYPFKPGADITTGASETGVSNFEELFSVFETMQDVGMVLCLHGEHPDAYYADREEKFLETLLRLASTFPKLKIVLEHITTKAAVTLVRNLGPNIAATITPHHLVLTGDDVFGGKLRPHNFCKPVAKRPEDRDALIEAATCGELQFFAGTDSAPHDETSKLNAGGAAGCFNALVAPQIYAHEFEKREALFDGRYGRFMALAGPRFYDIPPMDGTVTLERKPYVVPSKIASIVPFLAGETLPWSVVSRSRA